jgi:hypothetical protein
MIFKLVSDPEKALTILSIDKRGNMRSGTPVLIIFTQLTVSTPLPFYTDETNQL